MLHVSICQHHSKEYRGVSRESPASDRLSHALLGALVSDLHRSSEARRESPLSDPAQLPPHQPPATSPLPLTEKLPGGISGPDEGTNSANIDEPGPSSRIDLKSGQDRSIEQSAELMRRSQASDLGVWRAGQTQIASAPDHHSSYAAPARAELSSTQVSRNQEAHKVPASGEHGAQVKDQAGNPECQLTTRSSIQDNSSGSEERLYTEVRRAVEAAVARYMMQSGRNRAYSWICAAAASLAWIVGICAAAASPPFFGSGSSFDELVLLGMKIKAPVAMSSVTAITLMFLHRRAWRAAEYLDEQLTELEYSIGIATPLGREAISECLTRLAAKNDRHRRWWTLLRRDHGKQLAEIVASLREICATIPSGKNDVETKVKP